MDIGGLGSKLGLNLSKQDQNELRLNQKQDDQKKIDDQKLSTQQETSTDENSNIQDNDVVDISMEANKPEEKEQTHKQTMDTKQAGVQKSLGQEIKELETGEDIDTPIIADNDQDDQSDFSKHNQNRDIYNDTQKKVTQQQTNSVDDPLSVINEDMLLEGVELPTGDSRSIKKKKEEQEESLRQIIDSEKQDSIGLQTRVSTVQTQLFSKWLKRMSLSSEKDIDDMELESENSTDDVQKSEQSQQAGSSQPQPMEKLVKQQKLFTLNLRASIRFLKNLNSFQQRFSPEMVIYEDESGFVNGEQTLEYLGWKDISQVRQILFQTLDNEKIRKINQNQELMDQAAEDGLNLYNAKHPVLNKSNNIVAIENLTGEITILDSLDDLPKLHLHEQIMTTQGVAL